MSTEQHGDRLAENRPAPAGSATASRSRFRTMIAVIFCAGVLWWTMQTVLTENHAAKHAIRAMRSWNAIERVGAIQELEVVGLGSSKIAIPPLIAALGDRDARVRAAAAAALGPIGGEAASSGIQTEAVRTTIIALLDALKDPEPSVRTAAVNALVTLPVGGTSALVDPRKVTAVLVERLRDPDSQTRLSAIQIMAALGNSAEGDPPQELFAALHDESASIRALAVITLTSFPQNFDPLIPSFLQMMENDERAVRAACASGLVGMNPPSSYTKAVIPELITALGRPDGWVQGVACSLLWKLGPEARAAIPALIVIARETPSRAAGSKPPFGSPYIPAIVALAQIAPDTESARQVVLVLTELVRVEPPDRASQAVEALGGFGPAAGSAVPELIRALPGRMPMRAMLPRTFLVAEALGRIAPGTKSAGEAMTALVGLLQSGDSETRRAAGDALGGFGPAAESAIPDLIRILKDSADTDIAGAANSAAWALSRIAPGTRSSDGAVAALTGVLQSESPSMRSAAALTLRPFGAGASRAIPHLRTLLNDGEASVRSIAQETLERLLEAIERPK
jgi:HEAT repeat protein